VCLVTAPFSKDLFHVTIRYNYLFGMTESKCV